MSLVVRELTAHGRGAVSVLELRGPGALARVAALAGRDELPTRALELVRLKSGGELLDEALCWAESKERVELHLHGSPFIARRVVEELGAAPSSPTGDVPLEEQALGLLAEAPSEAAARILLDQSQGALRAELALLRAQKEPERERVANLLERGRVMRHLVTPPRLALAGPVNAGKSTLFNVLVGRERVVVDDEEGTTRDVVRERVSLGAYAVDLFDTAGEREASGASAAERVERAGQVLGREVRRGADLVIWLAPSGTAAPTPAEGPTRIVHSRSDEAAAGGTQAAEPAISALREPARARATVVGLFLDALALPAEPWRPGTPVPFLHEQTELLAGLLEPPHGDALAALESYLAR